MNEALDRVPNDPDYATTRSRRSASPPRRDRGRRHHHHRPLQELETPLPRRHGRSKDAPRWSSSRWSARRHCRDRNDQPGEFTVDGQPADELLGVATIDSRAPASDDSVLSTVSIESPRRARRCRPVQRRGSARSTFEANVVWELKQGDKTVRNGFTTAQECCTLSPYSFTVDRSAGRLHPRRARHRRVRRRGHRDQPGHEGDHGPVGAAVSPVNRRISHLSGVATPIKWLFHQRTGQPSRPYPPSQCSGSSEIFCQIFWLIWAASVSSSLTVLSTTGSEVRSAHRAAVFAISETSSLQ